MLSFGCDYQEGAHPVVLQKLVETNLEPLPGYGVDHYTLSAQEKIKVACECPEAEVRLLTGGTQTNVLVADLVMRDFQAMIAAETGHVSIHEAGAVERSGHKVLTLPHKEGKIQANDLESYMMTFMADRNREHMAQPGMVYISHPTEYGTLYSKKELENIAEVCHKYSLPLYMDGARLGYALASSRNDLTLPDIARLCDVFYIGGTKVGALCGEALVFTKKNFPDHFVTRQKRHCALLAKGRLAGIQFDALFTDDLYVKISRTAIECAERMTEILKEKGYQFHIDSPTNQVFIVVSNNKMSELEKNVVFGFWEKKDDDHTVIRLCTSWATRMEDVEELAEYL